MKTLNLDELPDSHPPIGCRWIFKRKLKEDGSNEGYKIRLAAKRYAVGNGVDYQKTLVQYHYLIVCIHCSPLNYLLIKWIQQQNLSMAT